MRIVCETTNSSRGWATTFARSSTRNANPDFPVRQLPTIREMSSMVIAAERTPTVPPFAMMGTASTSAGLFDVFPITVSQLSAFPPRSTSFTYCRSP